MKKEFNKHSDVSIEEQWLQYELFMADTVLADVNQDLVQFQNDRSVAIKALRDTDDLMVKSPDDTNFTFLYLVRKRSIEQDRINDLDDLIMKRNFVDRVIRYYIEHIKK